MDSEQAEKISRRKAGKETVTIDKIEFKQDFPQQKVMNQNLYA